MKTMLIAASIALALSAGIAKADDTGPLVTYGDTTCAEAMKDETSLTQYGGWVLGMWDNLNVTAYNYHKDQPFKGLGRVGENVRSRDIVMAVWLVCDQLPLQTIWSATLAVYAKMQGEAYNGTAAPNP